jgi:hypothetical protein
MTAQSLWRRILLVVGGSLVLAGTIGAVTSHGSAARADDVPGSAGFSGSYSLTARGDALIVEIDDKGAPLVPGGQLVFASPATAQATVDSLGNSQAFASAPYPGDFLANLTGTVNGLLAGQAPPVPPYPFIVTSNYPTTPSSNTSVGPYVLDVTSAASTSQSQAKMGGLTGDPAVASSVATSLVKENPDGTASAEASDSIQLVAIGNLIQLGHVTAHAKVTVGPDGTVSKSSELNLGSITVAGIQIGLTDKGLVLAGSATPLSAAPIEHLLAAAHLGMSYVPKTETARSIRSAGLAVTYTTNVPGQGPVTVTVTYGQVSASADSTPQASSSGITPSPSVAPPASTESNAVVTPNGAAVLPGAPGVAPGVAASGSGNATPKAPMMATTPRLVAGPAHPGTLVPAAGRLSGLMPNGKTFYLLLVVAGLLTVAGSRLLGELAIRRRMGAPNAG